jgi:hypothetical protein
LIILEGTNLISTSELGEPFHGCCEDITLYCGSMVVIKVIEHGRIHSELSQHYT